MTNKQAIELIKIKLEGQGTKFDDHYGEWIHSSGPMDREFFEYQNMGDYHVYALVLPSSYRISSVNEKKLNEFLKG